MSSFRLSFALWYHSSPYPTSQGDGQWADVIPWWLLFASFFSCCCLVLVGVTHDQQSFRTDLLHHGLFLLREYSPAPAWASSVDILSSMLSTGIAGESLLQRCLLSGAALSNKVLHRPYGRSPCTCTGFDTTELWELRCGRDSSIPGSLRARCIIKVMAHFRKE